MLITNPYRPPTMDLVVLMFILVWALSFFISLPLRIFATKESLGPDVSNCTVCLPTTQEHHYQVVLSQFVLYYLIPMLVIAVNSSRMALFLHKRPVMSFAGTRNTRRASLMVFLSTGTFSLCWLPGYVLELCVYLGLYRHGHSCFISPARFSSICIPAWTPSSTFCCPNATGARKTGCSDVIGNESTRRSLTWWRVSEHTEYFESFRRCWM